MPFFQIAWVVDGCLLLLFKHVLHQYSLSEGRAFMIEAIAVMIVFYIIRLQTFRVQMQ